MSSSPPPSSDARQSANGEAPAASCAVPAVSFSELPLESSSLFSPSAADFNSTVTSTASSGGKRRRHRTSTMFAKAEQEAKEQVAVELRTELGHRSDEDDEAKQKEELRGHKDVLQRASSRLHLNDAIRSREQSELHKTVNGLLREVEVLRTKLAEEAASKTATLNALHDSRVEKAELDARHDQLEANVVRQALRIEELEARNHELELQLLSQPQASGSGVKMVSTKAARKASPTVSVVEPQQPVTNVPWEAFFWAEAQVRNAIGDATSDFRMIILVAEREHRSAALARAATLEQLRQQHAHANEVSMLLALEGMRRNQLILEESNAASRALTFHVVLQEQLDFERSKAALLAQGLDPLAQRAELLHMSMNRHKLLLSHYGSQRGGTVTPSRRSVSQSMEDQSGRPWYPAGTPESKNYHRKSPGRTAPTPRSGTPMRTTSPAPTASARTASPGVSRTSSHTPQPRGKSPSPSPSQLSPPQPTPRTKRSPQLVPFQGAPPHLSKTVENMAALLEELQQWRGGD